MITADESKECLQEIAIPKTNKCVLNLHEQKLYSSQFKISILRITDKMQGALVFAIAGEKTLYRE